MKKRRKFLRSKVTVLRFFIFELKLRINELEFENKALSDYAQFLERECAINEKRVLDLEYGGESNGNV